MKLSRLLPLAALGCACAFAQNSQTTALPYDPSLAEVRTPAMAKPSAAQPSPAVQEQPASAQRGDAPLQARAIPPATAGPTLHARPNAVEPLLPTATVLRLQLVRPISTATARPGEKFFATLSSPVVVEGRTVIPSGTSVTCRLDSAHAGRRFSGKPWIALRALSAQLPSGEVLEFSASVIDTATPRKLDVDQEGRIRGTTFSPMDKVETGSLAGVGLIAGAVVAGPAGLFIGTASGAAIGAGHTLVKHKDLKLPAGTELILQLDAPATMRPAMDAAM